ncbi:MAG: alpha/beta hydrolase-fold protein [Acidimicrobiales bacterium]|nr:alpha/beta hydrolase-fold protein [Acidimicrobiales bacterium]
MDNHGRISRRTLLLGAAAGVAGGVVVERRIGSEKLLHKVGLASSPDHRATQRGPKPVTQSFVSEAMGGAVRFATSAPMNPLGVIMCLHGRNSNYRTAFDAVHLHDVVAEVGTPLVVVGVDGGASSYWHRRKSGVDPQAMLHDELWPRLDEQFGPSLPRVIMGWSMGGYGALLAAERHPDMYRAVVAASPALFRSFADSADGAFDDAADFRRHDVFAGVDSLSDTVVRIDCGTGDPFVGAARSLAELLPKANPGRFSRGFHDAAYWRSVAPAQVRTIAAALGV